MSAASLVAPSEPSPPVAVLMGPTACGKTDFAVRAAEQLPLDIISVDSAMVFRHMDIGTGKPPRQVLRRAPHQLIDLRDPEQHYSAGDFVRDACAAIAVSHREGRLPLLVGGTNLYFHALRHGIAQLPVAQAETRAALDSEARAVGWPTMHARLGELDPAAAARIHPNDQQRIQRALEVHALTGQTISALQADSKPREPSEAPLRFAVSVLETGTRARLHERIAWRFDAMLEAGFEAEVAALLARPRMQELLQGKASHDQPPSLRAVGYRQVAAKLNGVCDARQMREQALAATRQLGKRQVTWLRREQNAMRLDCDEKSGFERFLRWLTPLAGEANRADANGSHRRPAGSKM